MGYKRASKTRICLVSLFAIATTFALVHNSITHKSYNVICYAHRGASAYEPGNTMAAFQLPVEQGADGIETDIRETSDGVLVLSHDDELKSVSGEVYSIQDTTYGQLRDTAL